MSTVPVRLVNYRSRTLKAVGLRLSSEDASTTINYADIIEVNGVPSGSYGRDPSATILALRRDATDAASCLYVTYNGGANWSVVGTGGGGGGGPVTADQVSITDTTSPANWYSTDTCQGVADEVKAAIGGASSTTRAYTRDYAVADNEPLTTSIDKLDIRLWELAQPVMGQGGSLVAFADNANWYTADTVQGIADEVRGAIGGSASNVRTYTRDHVVTDNESLVASIDKIDTRLWELAQPAAGQGANLVAIQDTASPANWYTTDTCQGALDEIKAAIGGTNSSTRTYTLDYVVVDNEPIVASIDKIDQKLHELATGGGGGGAASGVTITDTAAPANWYTTDTCQGVADEVKAAIGGTSSTTRTYTRDHVVADNESLVASIDKLDTKFWDLAQTDAGKGASLVAIEDAGNKYTATTVEGALAKLSDAVAPGATDSASAVLTGTTASVNVPITVSRIVREAWYNPSAAGSAVIATQSATFDVTSYTSITQATETRNVQCVFSGSWNGGDIEITGTLADTGDDGIEVITAPASDSTVVGTKAFIAGCIRRVRCLGTRTSGSVSVQHGPNLGIITGGATPTLMECYETSGGGRDTGASISATGLLSTTLALNGARDYVAIVRLEASVAAEHSHGIGTIADSGHTHAHSATHSHAG